MSNNIHILMSGFERNMHEFERERNLNCITNMAKEISKSEGDMFESINTCISEYNKYCNNLNTLYLETYDYLNKAFHNIKSCEESVH